MNRNVVIVVTLVAVVLLAGWLVVFPLIIHKDAIRTELVDAFAAATGMELQIQDDIALKVLPVPHLSVTSLYVQPPVGSKARFLMTINDVEVWPALTSLFGKIAINKVQVSGVEVNFEELVDGKPSWEAASSYWQHGVFQPDSIKKAQSGQLHDMVLQVNDARINYTFRSGMTIPLEKFDASWTIGQASNVDAHFTFRNRPVAVAAHVGSLAQLLTQDNVPAELNISSGKDVLHYKGNAGRKNDRAVFNGDLDFTTEDVAYWVHVLRGQVPEATPPAGYRMLPVSIKAKIITQDNKTTFSDIAFDGTTIKGNGHVDITLPNQLDVKAAIKTLNMQDIAANGLFDTDAVSANPEQKNAYGSTRSKDAWEGTFDIKIDDMQYNNRHVTGAAFVADLSNGELTIPQLTAGIPGDGRILFSGIGKMLPEGVNIEGQVDTQGNNFEDAIGLVETAGLSLPPEDFKRFHIRTNVNVMPGEIQLSDLAARIESTSIVGGMVAKFGKRTSLRAAFGITGLNLDHIGALWGIESWQKTVASNSILGKSDGVLSVWLKHLDYDVYINSTLDNYMLGGKLYDKSDLNLVATLNKVELNSDDLHYGNSHLSGKVGLDVSRELPKIDVNVKVDDANVSGIFSAFVGADAKPAPGAPESQGVWPTAILDLKWFGFLNAAYNLKFAHLVCDKVEGSNVTIAGTINDRKLTIDSFTGNLYGANVAASMSIDGNSIPTSTLSGTVYGLRVERLAPLMPLFNGMSGLFNMNLAVNTSGINIQSMMSNLHGSMGAGGRDIEVHGFNLPAIIRAVGYVRTVADILGTVKRAFPNGDTVFPVFEGAWMINQGTAEMTRAKLRSQQAEGLVNGKTDLVHWTTNTGITFALKTLEPANPPVIIVNLSGDMDNTAIDFDTHMLEQYVNNKASENMLHQYGGHQ